MIKGERPCALCGAAPRAKSHAYCRECRNTYQNEYRRRRYRTEPAYRQKSLLSSRRRLYGLSEACYTEMWAQQGGVCAICLLEPEGRSLAVDHCHSTGDVRALLCTSCNTAVGLLKESAITARRATEYIEAL